MAWYVVNGGANCRGHQLPQPGIGFDSRHPLQQNPLSCRGFRASRRPVVPAAGGRPSPELGDRPTQGCRPLGRPPRNRSFSLSANGPPRRTGRHVRLAHQCGNGLSAKTEQFRSSPTPGSTWDHQMGVHAAAPRQTRASPLCADCITAPTSRYRTAATPWRPRPSSWSAANPCCPGCGSFGRTSAATTTHAWRPPKRTGARC